MLNEFRQDLVSGDWVLFATGRAKGHVNKKEKFYQPKEGCPFENLQASGNEEPVLVFNRGSRSNLEEYRAGNWTTVVVPNKNPAVLPGICPPPTKKGPFSKMTAAGFHELVITKEHDKSFCCFVPKEIVEVLTVYRERYREISKDECGEYILIFHNRGPAAGATIYHNHSQILSTPIMPPDILRSIKGSESYYKEHGKRVHEEMLQWEIKEGKRIIYDDGHFIAFCPFVSKVPYEIRIFPKKFNPRFEMITDEEIGALANTLDSVLKKMDKALDEPDFNFYIHTAPVRKNHHDEFYHWHIEVVPRLSIVGGLELGTDIYVNVIDPDDAAELLRKTDV
ncbi:MAG: HIT domain-containing protein [Candidatus Paceibacterota bacterium]